MALKVVRRLLIFASRQNSKSHVIVFYFIRYILQGQIQVEICLLLGPICIRIGHGLDPSRDWIGLDQMIDLLF